MSDNETTESGAASGLLDGVPPVGSAATVFLLLPLTTIFFWSVIQHFSSPLRKYPGPFLGGKTTFLGLVIGDQTNITDLAWTNFYRMWYAYKGNIHDVSKRLHEKYGPVVRMAPNYLDVDHSSLIKTCFDVQGVWQKVSHSHQALEAIL